MLISACAVLLCTAGLPTKGKVNGEKFKKMSDVPASESGLVAPSDGSTQANGTTKPVKQAKTKKRGAENQKNDTARQSLRQTAASYQRQGGFCS